MKNLQLCLRTVHTHLHHEEKYLPPSLVDKDIVMELTNYGMKLKREGHSIAFDADTLKNLASMIHIHRRALFDYGDSEKMLIFNFIELLLTLNDKAQFKLITNAFRIQERESAEEIAGVVLRASDLESGPEDMEELRVLLTKEIELISLLTYCQKREMKNN